MIVTKNFRPSLDRLRRTVSLGLLLLLFVGAPGAAAPKEKEKEGGKDSIVGGAMKDLAQDVVKNVAAQIAPSILQSMGLGDVAAFLFPEAEQVKVDYDRIANIVIDALNSHDLDLTSTEAGSSLETAIKNVAQLSVPGIYNEQESSKRESALRRTYDRLGDQLNRLDSWEYETIYTRGAIDTLRMKIYKVLAEDPALNSALTFAGMQLEARELQEKYQGFYSDFQFRTRWEFFQCRDGGLVDTLGGEFQLSQSGMSDESCQSRRSMLMSKLRGHLETDNFGATVSTRCTEEDEIPPTYLDVPVQDDRGRWKTERRMVSPGATVCSEVSVMLDVGYPDGQSASRFMFGCEARHDSSPAEQCNPIAARMNAHLSALLKDVKARQAYVKSLFDSWLNVGLAAEKAQREISFDGGSVVTEFTLRNNLSEAIDVKWHRHDGEAIPYGSVPAGGSWGSDDPGPGFRTLSTHWWGIYVNRPAGCEYGKSQDCRANLVCNFHAEQSARLEIDSLNPARSCYRAAAMRPDAPKVYRIRRDSYIPHKLPDGTEQPYSLPMPIAQCLDTCARNPECRIVRTAPREEPYTDYECLLGSAVGEEQTPEEGDPITSWRKFDRLRGFYVLKGAG